MFTWGGLDILLKLLKENSNVRSKCIKTLCVLALQLRIRNTVPLNSKAKQLKIDMLRNDILNGDDIVTFKLDDGNRVSAKKQFLSDRSEYFNILLYGDFKESNEEEIELHNVSSKSLQCLFNLLQYEIKGYQYMMLDLDLETVLDIIALAELYALMELSAFLATSVQQLYFTSRNVPIIYKWSLESGTNVLRIEAIAFALTANVKDNDRQQLFQKIFNSGLIEFFIEDVRTIISRFIK